MSRPLATLLCCTVGGMASAQSPQLGEPVSDERIAAADLTVMPDGDGLPEGAGTAADGEAIYARICAACHGADGTGGINDRLAGGHGTLTGSNPVKTVGSYWPYATTVFDYIRRAMPYTAPGTLSNDDVYSVTAYLLFLNGIVAKDAELNAETLPQVEMPNRDNFVWSYAPQN